MSVEFSSPDHRRGMPANVRRAIEVFQDHPKARSVRFSNGQVIATDRSGKVICREHRDRRIALERRLIELRAKKAVAEVKVTLARLPAPRKVDSRLEAVADLQRSLDYWRGLKPTDPRPPRR